MRTWIDILFTLGILTVLTGLVLDLQGIAWGQWLILGGLALMVPYFFRRSLTKEDSRSFRRRR